MAQPSEPVVDDDEPAAEDVRKAGEALQAFAEAIEAAAAEFETAADGTGRSGAASALAAVQRLMVAVEIPLDWQAPVFALTGALVALDQGRQPPLVRASQNKRGTGQEKGGKKPQLGDDVWIPRAVVAAAVELKIP